MNVWDTCTGSAFLEPGRLLREEHQSSQLRGHFPYSDTPTNKQFIGGSGLSPIEWSRALASTGSASPYIGEVLDTAFDMAQAIVVLMTPDEVAYLVSDHASGVDDPDTTPGPQARPNVLF